ncbi:MAG TPA: hypothetical protein PK431_00330 [Chitinophagales bacterium]|nr:hypothetical protein [Chitinophagales bacterium]
MNKILYISALITLFSASAIVGCKSKSEMDESTVDATSENGDTTTIITTTDAISNIKENVQQLSNDTVANAELYAYRTESERLIDLNNQRIQDYRIKISKPGMPVMDKMREKRIKELQEKNAALRIKIVEYKNNQSNTAWQTFKTDFNRDLDELNKSLDEFFTSDKK